MRPTSAINVTSPIPLPLHLPLPSHSMTIYPEYVTFVAKNTFCPGQLLMNDHTTFGLSCSSFEALFFCFRNSWQSTSAGMYGLVIMILVP